MANLALLILGLFIALSPPALQKDAAMKKFEARIADEIGGVERVTVRVDGYKRSGDTVHVDALRVYLKVWESDAADLPLVVLVYHDVAARAVRGKWRLASVGNAEFTIELDRDSLTNVFTAAHGGAPPQSVSMRKGGVTVEMMVDVGFGYPAPFVFTGRPGVDEETLVVMDAPKVQAVGMGLPGGLAQRLSSRVNPLVDLDDLDIDYAVAEPFEERAGLNFEAVARKAEVSRGKLSVRGTLRKVKL